MEDRKYMKKIGDFIIGKTIGQGTFGKVKQGVHAPTGKKVAIKILQKQKIKQQQDLCRVHNELGILYKKVSHPNIIKLLQLHESPTTVYIITEFITGTELYNLIVAEQCLDYQMCGVYFCQLLAAVQYLHDCRICHRDIKPENIIVDAGKLKLIDFGLSKQFGVDSRLRTSCGSPCYAAPQMLAGGSYDCRKSDVWAIGVTLYAMAAGHLPFQHQNTDRLYQLINTGTFPPITKMPSPKVPLSSQLNYSLSKQTSIHFINNLIAKCLRIDPQQRCTIAEIKQNVWVKQWIKYLNAHEQKFQDDRMLLQSMSLYFGKSVKQLRNIVDTKEIMSISTYYYLNLRDQTEPNTISNKNKSLSPNKKPLAQKQPLNSPSSHKKNNSTQNPESTKKPTSPSLYFDQSPQQQFSHPQTKTKSMTQNHSKMNSNTMKNILQQITQKNKAIHVINQNLNVNHHNRGEENDQLNRQFYQDRLEFQTVGKRQEVGGKEGEGSRGCFGGMHLGFVFGSLEEVYEFVKDKVGGDQGSIRQEQEQGIDSDSEDNPWQNIKKYEKMPCLYQQQQQTNNNKYIMCSTASRRACAGSNNPRQTTSPGYKIVDKYTIEYKGTRIGIKQVQNMKMYYLDVPAFFIF